MCYVITDGEHYLQSTTKVGQQVVNSLNQATCFTLDKANNVMKNIRTILRKYDWKIEYTTSNQGEVEITKVKNVEYNLIDRVNEIELFAREIQERNLYLITQLHEVDLEIVDIEHAAEFYTLNASQGYKIYKMLHDARNVRRDIKNEIEKIQYILNGSMKSALSKNISRSIEGINNRQYTPRVLKELFGI